jgi:beta-glucosidase
MDFTFAEVYWVQGVANDPDAATCPIQGTVAPPPTGGSTLTFLSDTDTLLAPFGIYLGSGANWAQLVDNTATTATISDNGALTLTPTAGLKDMTWNTAGTGAQVYLQAPDRDATVDGNQGYNYKGYLDAGGVLAFDVKVNTAPAGTVLARIDCAYPCKGELDATALFTDATLGNGGTHTFKIPLSCFQAAGTDFTAVNTPFLLFTDNPFDVTWSNVRWLTGANAGTGVASCAVLGKLTP